MLAKKLWYFTVILVLGSQVAFGQKKLTDEQIIAHIQNRLFHAKVYDHGKAEVAYKDGVATLTGTVDSLGVKMDAEKAARKIEEVSQVVNNLNVHAEDVTMRQIFEQARKQILTYYAYSIFDWITLEGAGSKLVVNGYVSQPYKKPDIGYFLAHIKGVAELQNNLEVLPLSSFDDEIRISVARAIYNDPFFITYASMANPPIHIVVKGGNVTLEGVVNSQGEKTKAEADARFAETFFNLTNNLRMESGQRK